jgi:HEAT repeat protein
MFATLLDPLSFFIGFATASVFWFLVARARPLWDEFRAGWAEQRETAHKRKTNTVEENHRRATLRRAQGMHLASQLFALDEILQEPLLLAPRQPVEPGTPPKFEDIITHTLPYLPTWPEIAAVYNPRMLTLPQALAGNANIAIIGQPGVGKTVALAHIASLAANRSDELESLKDAVPVLVHVADLNLPINDTKNALSPLIEAASEHAPILDVGRLPNFFQSVFKDGNALLLVDGYDEIPHEEQTIVADYLRIILKAYPKTRVVTTGTPEFLDGLIPLGFVPLALCAWSEQKNRKFIEHWGQLWTQTVAMEAWAQKGLEQVDPILLNTWIGTDNASLSPLELTLKVWGAYAGDSLGPHVLEAIATHIRRIAPPNTPLAALETLASQSAMSAQPVFDPSKAREWVKAFDLPADKTEGETPEPVEAAGEETKETKTQPLKGKKGGKTVTAPSSGLLAKMASSGLLIANPNNKMRFVHPVFAGYLAGHSLSSFQIEETILNQPDWSGKLLAMRYFAAHGDAAKLVQSMMEFSRLPIHRPLFAAARWLRDAPRNAAWRGKLFATLAAIMQTEGIPLSLRGQAMAAFVYSNDPSAAKLFRQFSTSLTFELVQLAVLGSGALKDAKAVDRLEKALEAPSLSVQRAACMALVAIGTNESLEAVARVLLHGDEEVRRAAGEALANDPKEGHAMLRDGVTLDDLLLRRSVVYGLGRIHEPWALELLHKAQVEDEQWIVRNAASEALDANTNAGSYAPKKLTPPAETPWLIEYAAKKGMGISPGAPVTDLLLLALKDDDLEVRIAALSYLKFTPKKEVIAEIYGTMYKDDPELRETAYNILWELGTSGIKLPHPNEYEMS